jgi:hypothetical protein
MMAMPHWREATWQTHDSLISTRFFALTRGPIAPLS